LREKEGQEAYKLEPIDLRAQLSAPIKACS